ncbi:metallophosphoesterase [Pelobacter seleniigenes]|uniref:metallophosphoesterase n=1 Tax=Pelobacter seleniigenes TaxID=407188 RepID=UPI0004A783F3|nr:metallophosphoesterase [Pelobacter seleniigenes]
MKLFLVIFLLTYAAVHTLVFWGFYPLFQNHYALPGLLGIWMAAMIAAPIAVRLCERQGFESLARGLAWVGYSWMGGVFIAFSLFAVIACGDLLMKLVSWPVPALTRYSVHSATSAGIVLFLVVVGSCYGLYEARNLRTERVTLTSSKLPPGTKPLRIAQISDLHLGLIHRDETLAPIIARLQQLEPDLLVATGDIVDAQINHLEGLAELWQKLTTPLGKFAVTGNHEYYAGLDQALDFLGKSGFRVLHNESIEVGDYIKLAGVDDPARGNQPAEEKALGSPSERFTLLLKHRPAIEDNSVNGFDLQLSGHTHRGQIFPFNLLTGLQYPRQNGLYALAGGAHLYTSRGTGTWGPPMRIFSPPEITLFEIVAQE